MAIADYDRRSGFAMVASNGYGWTAPLGTVAPVGIAAISADWTKLGAASDDGFVYGIAESSTSWTPYGTTSPWRTEVTSSVRTMQFTSWEIHRPIVISLMNRIPVGDLVEDADENFVSYAETASPAPDRRAFLFEFVDGSTWHRLYFPEGEVTDRGNVTMKQTEQMGYQFTVSTYPDEENNLCYHTYLTAARAADLLGADTLLVAPSTANLSLS